MKKEIDLEKYKQAYVEFIRTRKTIVLSMIDEEGHPFSSCAPFVEQDGKLYIYISQIAEHFRLLEKNEYVDVLFIADEADSKNAFATERARLRCVPENIGNNNEEIFTLLADTHGKAMVDTLRKLDFSLFELRPKQGRYITGFARAFEINPKTNTLFHVEK